MNTDTEFKQDEVEHLEAMEHIRTRSGMYIGSVDNATVLLREAVDNSIDELFKKKSCDTITIDTYKDKMYVVSDNGRGIPIKYNAKYEMTEARMCVAMLNTGSKFRKEKTGAGIGMNGVGIKAANALSTRFAIMSKLTKDNIEDSIDMVKDCKKRIKSEILYYVASYRRGEFEFEKVMTIDEIETEFGFKVPETAMTITYFIPDPEIFVSPICEVSTKNLSYLNIFMEKFYNKKVNILINGKEYTDGIKPLKFEFLTELQSYKTNETCQIYVTFDIDKNLSVCDSIGSVNSLVVNQGKHLEYVRNTYRKALKETFNIDHDYIMLGYKIQVLVKAGEVDFNGQTKEKLTKLCSMSGLESELKPMYEAFRKIFKSKDNLPYFEDHVMRLNAYRDAITNLSAVEKVKKMVQMSDGSAKSAFKVPKSVIDASSRDRSNCELFIVEGKSAGGGILKTRNSMYQAVFLLRGVPKNGISKDLDAILSNQELNAIISAIGCGVNEYHNTRHARYKRIIVAADADTDGGHIAALIAGFIAQKMTFIVEEHGLFVLDTPLYKQNGIYIYPGEQDKLDRSKPYNRFKGLGELSDADVKAVICDPTTRRLREITMDGAREALNILTTTSARTRLMRDKGILTNPYNVSR